MSTEEQVKKRWQKKGFSFGVFVDPPGQRWENFSHPTDELFMLFFGELATEKGFAKPLLSGLEDEKVLDPLWSSYNVIATVHKSSEGS